MTEECILPMDSSFEKQVNWQHGKEWDALLNLFVSVSPSGGIFAMSKQNCRLSFLFFKFRRRFTACTLVNKVFICGKSWEPFTLSIRVVVNSMALVPFALLTLVAVMWLLEKIPTSPGVTEQIFLSKISNVEACEWMGLSFRDVRWMIFFSGNFCAANTWLSSNRFHWGRGIVKA